LVPRESIDPFAGMATRAFLRGASTRGYKQAAGRRKREALKPPEAIQRKLFGRPPARRQAGLPALSFDHMKIRGPLVVAALCVVPLVLWIRAAPLDVRFADTTTALNSIAVLFALAGASAFALNLILGARFKLLDALFGGLDKLYRFHRRNGQVAFVLLVCHAASMIASRATLSTSSALSLLSPAAGWTVFAGVVALVLAAIVLALTLYARLGHEVFVYVHRFFGGALIFATLHMFWSPGLQSTPAVRAYLGVLVAAALAAWIYRSLFGSVLVRRYQYAVVEVRQPGPSVVAIGMEPMDGHLRYMPGQFVFVTFYSSKLDAQLHPMSMASEGSSAVITLRPGDAREQFHPFSLTSAPAEGRLRIAIKAVGDFTSAIQQLTAGAVARVEGPYGGFSYVHTPNPAQIWIAGGIGITPFVSMARSLEGIERDLDIDLFYGFKTRAEGYFLDELAAISDRSPHLRFFEVSEDEQGRITTDMLSRVSGDLSRRDFFVCGPPAMIDNMKGQLMTAGVRRARIHYEKFALGGPRA
jgi:predicted ferric reductase